MRYAIVDKSMTIAERFLIINFSPDAIYVYLNKK